MKTILNNKDKIFFYGAILTTLYILLYAVMLDHFNSFYNDNPNTINALGAILVLIFYVGGFIYLEVKRWED